MSCEKFVGNPVFKTLLDSWFAIGVFGSYVPQIVLVARRRDTEGLNPFFLLLMNIGSSSSFFNIWLLSRARMACCRVISAYDCYASLLGFLQLFSGFLGPTLLLVLATRFRESGANGAVIKRSGQFMLAYDLVLVGLVLALWRTRFAEPLATVMGLTSIGAGVMQYFPQIVTTYRLKHVGSLSVVSMLIQMPGGYMWCLSLALSRDSRWSTWAPTFFASTSQAVLLALALYFMYKNRGTPKNPDGDYERLHAPPVDLESIPNEFEISDDDADADALDLDLDADMNGYYDGMGAGVGAGVGLGTEAGVDVGADAELDLSAPGPSTAGPSAAGPSTAGPSTAARDALTDETSSSTDLK